MYHLAYYMYMYCTCNITKYTHVCTCTSLYMYLIIPYKPKEKRYKNIGYRAGILHRDNIPYHQYIIVTLISEYI